MAYLGLYSHPHSTKNDSVTSIDPYKLKLIVFFHGNAEDLGISYEMLDHLRTALKINVIAVEYPGYGVYEDPEGPSEEKIY